MNRSSQSAMQIGLERLPSEFRSLLRGKRFGLVMNRASVNRDVRLASDVLADAFPGQLTCLLTPQHGLWGEQQANMIETEHSFHHQLQIPIFSLYSATRRPTHQMLQDVDCLVIDLQDVGTRVYTFIWTMLYCLEECAAAGVSVIVLDRPNPIGGSVCEGPLLDMQFRSFVGEAAIPMRHGLTIGELALMLNRTHTLDADLTVVPLAGWQRESWFDQLDRVWVPPSPNMPTLQTAIVYPGQVLLEGTCLSEGRGTAMPFEVVGAPFIDPELLAQQMEECQLDGVRFLPLRFTPAFDKWQGQSCGGISIHVTDRSSFRSYEMTLQLLKICQNEWPDQFHFLPPPYEYEFQLDPIDIITGNDDVRRMITGTESPPSSSDGATEFDAQEYWLYQG